MMAPSLVNTHTHRHRLIYRSVSSLLAESQDSFLLWFGLRCNHLFVIDKVTALKRFILNDKDRFVGLLGSLDKT